jgi:PPM family protein phosphatase
MGPHYEHVQALASGRPRSQDSVGIFERSETVVVVVADGGGGMRGGESASRCLVAVVGSAVNDLGFELQSVQPWIDLFRATDMALAVNGAGETTGLVVALGARGLVGVSVGDSEAWVVTPTAVQDLTIGQQTKQRFGSNRATPTAFQRPALGGVLLIASDGLFKYASIEVIAHIVRSNAMKAAAELLVDLVRLRSGEVADDVSIVLVRESIVSARPS